MQINIHKFIYKSTNTSLFIRSFAKVKKHHCIIASERKINIGTFKEIMRFLTCIYKYNLIGTIEK